jgi:hypothetical protein
MAKKKFIQGAIKHPGALTASAKAADKSIAQFCGGKNLSTTDQRRCNLAKTLKSFGKR